MSTDQTINLDTAPVPLKVISAGLDGEALVGASKDGASFELRVLSSASPSRCAELRASLARMELIDHSSVRKLTQQLSVDSPPTYKLDVPYGVDPLADRLSKQIPSLTDETRLRVAAAIVQACTAAHRVGAYHGSFAPSTVLVSQPETNLRVCIDFTVASCSQDVSASTLSVEDDLRCLHQLFTQLIGPSVESNDSNAMAKLGGRSRAILRQWLKPAGDAEFNAPTLGQWQSILEPFVANASSLDQTGIIAPPAMPIGSGSTSETTFGIQSGNDSATPLLSQLGRFQLENKIGEGGMGTVYRAIDSANGETVAIKVLRNHGKNIAQSIRRFRKEARLLADVQNDHVTKLIEVGEDNGQHFLAMEFIEGVDLKGWLAGRAALPENDALRLTADLARALVDAHAREVIHRDIKPENVLLKLNDDARARQVPMVERPVEDFTVKLTDFGIARHVNQSESMEMTRAGSVMGTPKYMSPEQCKSTDTIGPAADVYSLGITLYEMLAGKVPFNSDDFMKLAAMHCFETPPSVQKRNATVTDGAAKIVTRALAKKPADRFGDAGQMLSEILKLLRGDAAEIEAHPKLPANHDAGKLWEKTVTWQLDSEAADLWPLVSNTERLNEAIGLPPVEYRTEKAPQLGLRKFGSFTISGVKVSWEEHPFEWIEGHRMGILREFESGPFKWFMSVVSLQSNASGGTTLSHQVRIEPRNLLGRVLTTIEADWKGFRNLEKVYRRMDRSLQGRLGNQQGTDAFEKVKSLSRHQATRLTQRIGRIVEAGVDSKIATALQTTLREWSAQELAQLRPLAMADRLGVDGSQMTDACLVACTEGVLNLRWDVLCPTCRAPAFTSDKLSNVDAHTHCEACDVDFQSNLADSIEMVFQAHPEIRQCNEGQYCIGGPEHSPHVVAQVRIDTNECLSLPVDLSSGDYLIRGPRLPKTQTIRVQSTSAPSTVDFTLSTLGGSTHTPKLRSGRQTLTLVNDLDSLHVVRIERIIPRGDVVTAAMAAANPLFRKLFPHQKFASTNPVETETMTFLASCINNVDQLYASMGDADAYTAIHAHHAQLAVIVSGAGGTVVKTMGEKMLAAFVARDDAVTAAQRIRESLQNDLPPSIELGIGIHCGPTLVTTQNNQLDYFGGTVRAVSALTELASDDTLIAETVYTDPSVAERIHSLCDDVEQVDLPGAPGVRVKRI
ncbi:protein kinase domain-containing protein [Neorhodopirellula lusitana]|uniref:protein kinase domain-containing protein n=1 Tax=Neorhodopirellula lusitana TaxID=445327 RepID=UPI00384AED5C